VTPTGRTGNPERPCSSPHGLRPVWLLLPGPLPRTVADRHYVVPPAKVFDEAITWLGKQLGQIDGAPVATN
jgi:hypothetical protein